MDQVNHPEHYKHGKMETWDVITALGCGYLDGNVIKYIARYRYKGKPVEDLKKARAYLDKLIEAVEKYPTCDEDSDTSHPYWPYYVSTSC